MYFKACFLMRSFLAYTVSFSHWAFWSLDQIQIEEVEGNSYRTAGDGVHGAAHSGGCWKETQRDEV